MTRALGLSVCALLFCSAASAEVVTVRDTMDYSDNGPETGVYFHLPGEIIDHQPYYRCSVEDWGWTHDLTALAPKDATGIQSTTLSIEAWDVTDQGGESDVIYANGVALGTLAGSSAEWSTTSFDLPQRVLDKLWREGQVHIAIDIDSRNEGFRATLGNSVLTVGYITDHQVPEPATAGLLSLGSLFILHRKSQQIALS